MLREHGYIYVCCMSGSTVLLDNANNVPQLSPALNDQYVCSMHLSELIVSSDKINPINLCSHPPYANSVM
jgi:hypothetical protein